MSELSDLLYREIYPKLNIMEIVPELKPTDRGMYYLIDCPDCNQHEAFIHKDNQGHMKCNHKDTCRYEGTLWEYIGQRDLMGDHQVLERLAEYAHYALDIKPEDRKRYEAELKQARLLECAQEFFVEQLWSDGGKSIRNYLTKKRGYTEAEIKYMGLGNFPSHEKLTQHLRQRDSSYSGTDEKALKFSTPSLGVTHVLTIPYRTPTGQMKGFAVRSLSAEKPKYLYTSNRDTFFNIHAVAQGYGQISLLNMYKVRQSPVMVVEGFLDALIASAKGIRGVVATGGSEITRDQLSNAMRRKVTDFVLCLDNDEAGREGTNKSIDLIRKYGGGAYVIKLPKTYKDLDEYLREHSRADVTKLAEEACMFGDGVRWRTERILERYPREKFGDYGARKAIDELKAYQFTLDPLDRRKLLEAVLEKWDISESELTDAFSQHNKELADEQAKRRLGELTKYMTTGDSAEVMRSLPEKANALAIEYHKSRAKPPEPLSETLQLMHDEEEKRDQSRLLGYRLDKFADIARALDGIQPGLYVIGAYPNVGKTAFLNNLLLDLLDANRDIKGLYFSFADSKAVIRNRLMSIISGIPINKVQKRQANDRDKKAKERAHGKLLELAKQGRLCIKDISEVYHIDQLDLEVRERSGEGLFLMLDGLHNVEVGIADAGLRQENVDRASKMKALADTYRIPIFCTVEVRKPTIRAKCEEPTLHDIIEAGKYGYNANLVWILCENQKDDEGKDRDEFTSVLTLKYDKNKLSHFKGFQKLRFITDISKIEAIESDKRTGKSSPE